MPDPLCFGIDLGTTCSAIGLVRNGTPQLLRVDGDLLLPSVVSFSQDPGQAAMVGTPALNHLPLDPGRGVRSAKRHMGTPHRWSMDGREVSPVDVGALIIGRLLDAAEAELGQRPQRAVITVPAWFTQAQRSDTRAAGVQAGLVVERIINEPTAAALAHAQGETGQRKVMAYDLGGGTFDVSVVSQDGPVIEVLASHGDSRLGGDDIDLALMDHVLSRLATEDPALRELVEGSQAARVRLRRAVEQAKIKLSETLQTTLAVPFLVEGTRGPNHLEMTLSRDELEDVAAPWINRTLASVDQVLSDAGLEPADIDELLLVGGATCMPLVWSTLKATYGLEGSHAIPPHTAVALGAAIQGAIVDGSRVHGILVDVAPYSLSVGVCAGASMGFPTHFVCRVLTPRNAPLPSRHTERFFTASPTQKRLQLPIFQGSRSDPRRNLLLGMVELGGLPPAPQDRDSRPIAVELRHDLDGMVSITVTDELSGRAEAVRLAVDGDEQDNLREALQEMMSDLILGFDEEDEDEDDSEDGALGALETSGDMSEALRAFSAVLDGEALSGCSPDVQTRLRQLAMQGAQAAKDGDDGVALARYDALSDVMFDEGVFL